MPTILPIPKAARAVVLGVCVAGGAWIAGPVLAQTNQGSKASIYSCVDAKGKRHTSDRPIPECQQIEQRVLNSDGSLKRTLPPAMSDNERAELAAKEQAALLERAQAQDMQRRDKLMASRYPNEVAHNKARKEALDDVEKSIETSKRRLIDLADARQRLDQEAQFFQGKRLPFKLKQMIDANEAATTAQQSLVENQQIELVRINTNFDADLLRLRKLWAASAAGLAASAPASGPTPGAGSGAALAPASAAPHNKALAAAQATTAR